MMRLDESSLKTDEPYLIPGYCGYCPQFKYKIEDTFGKTTHQLLTSRKSKAPIDALAPLELNALRRKNSEDKIIKSNLIKNRGKHLGEQQKYGVQMVPGYTGYIPKGQHYFGDRYAVISENAISRFESDQQEYNERQQTLRRTIRRQNDKQRLPLKPIKEKSEMYFPKGILHSLSPYIIANDDPRKYMISGYTGFVPNSRGIIGMSYPSVTNRAMCEFTTISAENKILAKTPILLRRPEKVITDTTRIYYEDSGIVPHYTGHIPGEKFRYGRTFGHSTTNATPPTKKTAALI